MKIYGYGSLVLTIGYITLNAYLNLYRKQMIRPRNFRMSFYLEVNGSDHLLS